MRQYTKGRICPKSVDEAAQGHKPAPEAYQSVAAALDAGPQPDYIGTDLDAIAGQLIDKYGPPAGQ